MGAEPMNTTIQLNLEEWEQQFRPIPNTFSDDPAWSGMMFETYGEEHDFVCQRKLGRQVWTLVEGDNGTYIVNGYSFVNRIGYFICKVAYDQPASYEVSVR